MSAKREKVKHRIRGIRRKRKRGTFRRMGSDMLCANIRRITVSTEWGSLTTESSAKALLQVETDNSSTAFFASARSQ